MEYMGTKEAAEKWGYTKGTISKWCREGKISLVIKPEKKVVSGEFLLMQNVLEKRKESKCCEKKNNYDYFCSRSCMFYLFMRW